MWVRMTKTAAGPDGVWLSGSVVEVDAKTGKRLVGGGYAVNVAGPGGREVAVVAPAEVADAPAAKRRKRPSKPRKKVSPAASEA